MSNNTTQGEGNPSSLIFGNFFLKIAIMAGILEFGRRGRQFLFGRILGFRIVVYKFWAWVFWTFLVCENRFGQNGGVV